MKKFESVFVVMFINLILIACVNTTNNQAEVESKLKSTLSNYLQQNKQTAQKHLHYEIRSVQFFEETTPKPLYICEFKVHLHSDSMIQGNLIDTEGVMKFRISKDFMILSRDY